MCSYSTHDVESSSAGAETEELGKLWPFILSGKKSVA